MFPKRLLIGAAFIAAVASVHAATRDLLWTGSTFSIPAIKFGRGRRPKKKALLIGINYGADAEKDSNGVLLGPHRDVLSMKQLLIDAYDYKECDIMTMIDNGEDGDLQPTHANIIRELENFIVDPQPGDRYYFHYAGHSDQRPCEDGSEDDNLDEFIIPCDSLNQDKIILDDELRKYLVERLTLESNLVAVFDTCHSATLLDLSHHVCNRRPTPWVSRGAKPTEPYWLPGIVQQLNIYENTNVASDTVILRKSSIDINTTSGHVSVKSRSLSLNSGRIPVSSRTSSITQSAPPKPASPMTHTQTTPLPWPSGSLPRLKSASPKRPSLKAVSLRLDMDIVKEEPSDFLTSPKTICTSPNTYCNGDCRPTSPTERPYVVCLSSCKDSQVCYEGPNGESMTTAMIKVLRSNPHPPLKDLVSTIGHDLHTMALQRHGEIHRVKKWVKQMKRKGKEVPKYDAHRLDSDTFMDPQLSSQKPLDLDRSFVI